MKKILTITLIIILVSIVFMVANSYLAKLNQNQSPSQPQPAVKALIDNEQSIKEDYPLAPHLPYEPVGLYVDYKDKQTLRVRGDISQAEAEKLVNDYATSKHVDISSHTIVVE